jgi:uncharacterized protein YPO0396
MRDPVPKKIDVHLCPVYWFALLYEAIRRGDYEAAARSQRTLRDLGVHVVYRVPEPSHRQEVGVHG